MDAIDRFLREHYDEFGLGRFRLGKHWDTLLITPRFVTSRHVVGMVFARGARTPSLVVKVPRQPGDNGSVRHEGDILGRLNRLGMGRTQGVPEAVGTDDIGEHTVLVETAVTGVALDPHRAAGDLAAAVRAGCEFAAGMPLTAEADANGGWYERALTVPLNALTSLLPTDSGVAALVERTHLLLSPLRTARLPAVVEHGDLSHPNLLLAADGRLQAVDWERSRMDGLPGHDLVFYLQYLSESSERAFTRARQLAAFDAAFGPAGWAVDPLRRHLRLRGVDPGLAPLLVLATWARAAATLAYRLDGQGIGGQEAAQTRAAVFEDRDFWLWRHTADLLAQA